MQELRCHICSIPIGTKTTGKFQEHRLDVTQELQTQVDENIS
jgi:hypothetical protein